MSATEIAVQGTQLLIGNGSSPETFEVVANVDSVSWASQTRVVDTSNITDFWMRVVATLREGGKITFTLFWVPDEITHSNNPKGLRGLWYNATRTDFQIQYSSAAGSGTDAFTGYVTKFAPTFKTADVLRASIEITVTGQPSLV